MAKAPAAVMKEAREQQEFLRKSRRLVCKDEGHRWWPVGGPGDVEDRPSKAVCLKCTALLPLSKAMRHPNVTRRARQ